MYFIRYIWLKINVSSIYFLYFYGNARHGISNNMDVFKNGKPKFHSKKRKRKFSKNKGDTVIVVVAPFIRIIEMDVRVTFIIEIQNIKMVQTL